MQQRNTNGDKKMENKKELLETKETDEIDAEEMLQILQKSRKLMTVFNEYRSAIMEVETKLRVLDMELSMDMDKNPIEAIHSRLKRPQSILEKLQRRGYPITLASIRENLLDIAGIRVICDFTDDIYKLERLLARQTDITVLKRKDYIKNPKPNGYRSLHLTVSVPIFLIEGVKNVPVEVQFRTMAMDFWASLEHKLKYKKDISEATDAAARLKECADKAFALDREMMRIRSDIDEMESEKS